MIPARKESAKAELGRKILLEGLEKEVADLRAEAPEKWVVDSLEEMPEAVRVGNAGRSSQSAAHL